MFTDDIGINILSFLDHKTGMKYRIQLVEDKLKLAEESGDGDVYSLVYKLEWVYKLECLNNYLTDPTVWITGDVEDYDDDNTYPSESDYLYPDYYDSD